MIFLTSSKKMFGGLRNALYIWIGYVPCFMKGSHHSRYIPLRKNIEVFFEI
jgi:hypothetical protein